MPLPTLPPVDSQEQVQPEPELILERRMKKMGHDAATEVLVKWIGIPIEDSTWKLLVEAAGLESTLCGQGPSEGRKLLRCLEVKDLKGGRNVRGFRVAVCFVKGNGFN